MAESKTTTAQQAHDALAHGAVLVDVREPDEWRAGHAPQARHIPMGDLADQAGHLPDGVPLLLICRSGNRSGKAADMLAAMERDAANVDGGMQAWAAAGLPVVAEDGSAGRVA